MTIKRLRTDEHNAKIAASLKARGSGSTPTKFCPRCERELPRENFAVRPNGYTYSYCIPCQREYNAEKQRRYASQPEKKEQARQRNRRTQLRRKYGISVEEYDALLAEQGGVCAICHQPPSRDRVFLDVDHCHGSGNVRGLLCSHCNRSIGLMNDDPKRLRAAANYLER